MKMFHVALAFATAACLFASHSYAELVTNGDFETGDLTGWTFAADANAEPLMVADVAMFMGSNAFRVNPGNDSGGGAPEAGGTLAQTLSLVGGTSYTVSAGLLAIRDLGGTDNIDGGTISISLDGTLLHTFDVGSIQAGDILTDSVSLPFFATTTGNAPLELRFTRGFRNSSPVVLHYADNISVVVPEPSSVALLALGALGLKFRLRDRSHPG